MTFAESAGAPDGLPAIPAPEPVDGNAMAGVLDALVGHDMTGAGCQCGGCGRSMVLAQARVYDRCPGIVARCPGCDHPIVVISFRHDLACVDLMGTSMIEVWPASSSRAHTGK